MIKNCFIICLCLLCSSNLSSQFYCNSGEYLSSLDQQCHLCSEKTKGCLLCDQSTGQCTMCQGLFPAWNNPGESVYTCTCPTEQQLTFNSTSLKNSCQSKIIADSYYNASQLETMQDQKILNITDFYLLQSMALGVNLYSGIPNQCLVYILEVFQSVGISTYRLQSQQYFEEGVNVALNLAFNPYSDSYILQQILEEMDNWLTDFTIQFSNKALSIMTEIIGQAIERQKNYNSTAENIITLIEVNLAKLKRKLLISNAVGLLSSNTSSSLYYSNLFFNFLRLDEPATIVKTFESRLALEYSVLGLPKFLAQMPSGINFIAHTVQNSFVFKNYPEINVTLLSGIQSIEIYSYSQNSYKPLTFNQLDKSLIMTFPTSAEETVQLLSYYPKQFWEPVNSCEIVEQQSICYLQTLSPTYFFSIQGATYLAQCGSGEYKISGSNKCGLCSGLTSGCTVCDQTTGDCIQCKGLIQPFIFNNQIICQCSDNYYLFFNSTSQAYSCQSQTVLNNYWNQYSKNIQAMTIQLTGDQLLLLQSLSYSVINNNTQMLFITKSIEKALKNLMQSKSTVLQEVAKILIGTVYNGYSSFKLINQTMYIANNLKSSDYAEYETQSLIFELYGLICSAVVSKNFDFEQITSIQKKYLTEQIQTNIDNLKYFFLKQHNFNSSKSYSYHFTNLFMHIQEVNQSENLSIFLYKGLYSFFANINALAKLPTSNTNYFTILLQENQPYNLISNKTLLSFPVDISFFTGSRLQSANSYLTNLNQNQIKINFPAHEKCSLVKWISNPLSWDLANATCDASSTGYTCSVNSIAKSLLYGVVNEVILEQ